jgi:hypothetical protein
VHADDAGKACAMVAGVSNEPFDLRLGSARPSDAYNVLGALLFCAFCFLLSLSSRTREKSGLRPPNQQR